MSVAVSKDNGPEDIPPDEPGTGDDRCDRILLLDKGRLLMDKVHVPGEEDAELEAYFLDAAGR